MFKIAVCDDSLYDMKMTRDAIQDYIELYHRQEVEVYVYESSSRLLEEMGKGLCFDAYILDIVMPEKNGIEVAEQIRKNNRYVPIIYTTSSEEFALKAYHVQAVRYLMKPVTTKHMSEAIEYVIQMSRLHQNAKFEVNTTSGVEHISIQDIMHVENSSRRLAITKRDGTVVHSRCIRESFESNVKTLLQDKRFIQTHKSYLVNMDYIRKISPVNVELDDGRTIPISKSNSTVVKREYLKYLSEENGGFV